MTFTSFDATDRRARLAATDADQQAMSANDARWEAALASFTPDFYGDDTCDMCRAAGYGANCASCSFNLSDYARSRSDDEPLEATQDEYDAHIAAYLATIETDPF